MPEPGEVKYGKDDKLERLANKLLNASVGDNKRGIERDIEKVSYEAGYITRDELQHYDPDNDWDAQDSVFAVAVDPSDLSTIEPTICVDFPDGNVRARNPKMQERRALTRQIGDEDGWGTTFEEIPLLGVNDGPRKICAKCKKTKGLHLFSSDKRNADGLHSWCKECRRESGKKAYVRKNKRRHKSPGHTP